MVSSQTRKLLRKLAIPTAVVAVVLVILLNARFVHSSIVGIGASLAYFVLVGFLLGKALLADETRVFVRSVYGVFLVICFLVLIGLPITVFYTLNYLTWAATLCVPAAIAAIYTGVRSLKQTSSEDKIKAGEKLNVSSYISPAYIIPLALVVYAEFLIVDARSGWVQGAVWNAISPLFSVIFLLAALSVFLVVLYSRTKYVSKLLLVTMFSLVSITIPAVVLYPGDVGDPLSWLGMSQLLSEYGNFRTAWDLSFGVWNVYWLFKEKGLTVLTVIVTKLLEVDIYWVHTFITPVLWGTFVPLTAFGVLQMVCKKERISVLAAFLSTFVWPFLVWGSISTANSLGYLFFFVSLFFSALYFKSAKKGVKPLLIALLFSTTSGFAHPLTGTMSFAFLFLAISMRRYKTVKVEKPRQAYLVLLVSIIGASLFVLAVFGFQNAVYLYFSSPTVRTRYAESVIAFSPQNLIQTDPWELIFGEFVSLSFKESILWAIIPFLGILGLAYAMKNKIEFERDSTLFMLLAFTIISVDYVILKYAMVHVPFGPGRLWLMRDLISISFVAVAVNSIVEFLEGKILEEALFMSSNPFKRIVRKLSARQVIAGLLVGLSLSAFAVASAYQTYSYGKQHPTGLEVEAIRYIDEHTDGGYVALTTSKWTALVGHGFVGSYNPRKYYVYGSFLDPSVSEVFRYMQDYQAGVAYYVVPSVRTPDFDGVVVKASQSFGLFEVLSDESGEIYIFYYKIPHLPPNHPNPDADVMAFYWDTPPGYLIQNGLGRVSFSPERNFLAVRDFYGELYESISLSETLIDGENLGNLTSVEYFEDGKWIEWLPTSDVISAPLFQFRFRFEDDSLIGVVEKGKPYVQLWWEEGHASSFSLESGEFNRLYIPGLVGGRQPYNVSSLDFGLLYTFSRTDGVSLRPAYYPEIDGSSLTFSQIARYCNLKLTSGYFSYEYNVQNNADIDQWADIEVWLPDEVYLGVGPQVSYSIDEGKNWTPGSTAKFLKTLKGVSVNWGATLPRQRSEIPALWTYVLGGAGGKYTPIIDFTVSKGAQNRLLFGIYLPAQDSVLIKFVASVYYVSPLKMTYIFNDSDLNSMEENLIKFYDYGSSQYVGGISLTNRPISLSVIEHATGRIGSLSIAIPPDTSFSLFFVRGDTTADTDGNGVPDLVEG